MWLQGYDFVHLNRTEGVRVQVGGSDQWGNITAGTDLLKRLEADAPECFGLTFPLLVSRRAPAVAWFCLSGSSAVCGSRKRTGDKPSAWQSLGCTQVASKRALSAGCERRPMSFLLAVVPVSVWRLACRDELLE